MKTDARIILAVFLVSLTTPSQAASLFPGNGATGFGGPVGTGSLSISDSLSGMSITFNRGAGAFNDDLVLFLDTQAGGFIDTSMFSDNADGGRTAISGFSTGASGISRTLASFPSGFGADYALSIENGFIGVFGLASGGAGSLNSLFGQGQSGNNLDSTYSINLSTAQMSQIGLTAGSGQTFHFVGSLISTAAYRSNETIGASITTPGDASGNAGLNNPQLFSSSLAYTLTQVPEPSSMSLIGAGLLGVLAFSGHKQRRRHRGIGCLPMAQKLKSDEKR